MKLLPEMVTTPGFSTPEERTNARVEGVVEVLSSIDTFKGERVHAITADVM